MQAKIILRDGNVLPLSDEVYELVLSMIWSYEPIDQPELEAAVERELDALAELAPTPEHLLPRKPPTLQKERDSFDLMPVL